MEFRYQVGDELKMVRVERTGDHYEVTIGDHTYRVEVEKVNPGELDFTVGGNRHRAYLADDGPRRYVAFDANAYMITRAETAQRKRAAGAGGGSLAATMPGQVVKVLVAEGDAVTRGQALVLLEAMKMEIRVTAPQDGRIKKLLCSPGQVVERGQVLLELSRM
jgi:biotin carboxyl carrier protein